jgi:hypothetical protein
VCGLSFIIAQAALSNCIESSRFGQVVSVVFPGGYGEEGVLELLLAVELPLLPSDWFPAWKR